MCIRDRTPAQLPSALSTLYTDFGTVSAEDFALLSYAGSHLPPGARVLVAPGSAGEFLPAYDPTAVLLYPMLPGWTRVNASYTLLVSELTNGTLEHPEGFSALRFLDVQFVIVTAANSILWPAFSYEPFLNDPYQFPVLYENGTALLIAVAPPPPLYPFG